MNYKVETITPFRKEVKKLIKKYPSLKDELAELGEQLSLNPNTGVSLGNNCNKIRIAIRSKGKGKSSGARVITHFYIAGSTVYLLYIYDKSEQANLSDSYIKELLKYINP